MSTLEVGHGIRQGVVVLVNRRRYIAVVHVLDEGLVVFDWVRGIEPKLNDRIEGRLDRCGETRLRIDGSGDELQGHVHLVRCSWNDAQLYTR